MRAGLDLRRVEAVVLTHRRPDKLSGHRRANTPIYHTSHFIFCVHALARRERYLHVRAPGRAPAPRDALSLVSLVNTGRVRDRVQCVIQYYESVCS